ncbi:hypothetical protein BAUCODRAFT_38201 [Baudoinia panamericana UAMH 10762]|uniref:Osmotin, thaumatin-like protein n=1 Tax=Baudoinia panamericana (strain UAMH 10762) TaxID=717646 RepID=M2M784_BAUPA|nr:uncharacterized protein BAUCODRAFT_38201 [Baudoinia panamericana UAMH 10762]EMC92171.1 hypothetical protein BAUCODRAFT_38201 [Baudoinia panamericana UAMH 10762]
MRGSRFALLAGAYTTLTCVHAEHHMQKYKVEKRQDGDTSIPLIISSSCPDIIYPAVLTQGGTGPTNTGWAAQPNSNQTLYVSEDWQGRVWARTNCSNIGSGSSSSSSTSSGSTGCSTGDCGGLVACKGPGTPPATLAEFTLSGSHQQTFYDISLVDGYNLPMAIQILPNDVQTLEQLDQSTTNPSCVASPNNLAAQNFNPYANNQQFLGTSSSSPLPFDTKNTANSVTNWCPWDLQIKPPSTPSNGVYPYPDTNIARPAFNPCISACSKYNQDNYCCLGAYNSVNKCQPGYYSKAAKGVCPDAYSYAFDDQTSTFIVPAGGGFQVVFCPGGRSTNIIASKGSTAIEHGSSNGSHWALGSAGRPLIDGTLVRIAVLALAGAVFL